MSLSPESAADPAKETATLLRRYVKGDGSAFRDLVRRYHPLVFAAALRRAEGRRALAEDATQLVFIDLARRAPSLNADERLSGWLHQRAVRAAATLMRGEARRHVREQRAATEAAGAAPDGRHADTSAAASPGVDLGSELGRGLDGAAGRGFRTGPDGQQVPVLSLSEKEASISSPDWQELAPHLDEALQRLSAADRDAVLLRCVEGRNFCAVGAALGLSDDAAQKRVSRALEKLRAMLLRRRGRTSGITISLSTMAGGLSADHARASAENLSGEVLQTATRAMSAAGAMTTVSRILPHVKAGAIGGAAACAAWAWPLIQEHGKAQTSLMAPVQTSSERDFSASTASAAIRFPIFAPVPKVTAESSVGEIVRGIAALAAGPYNELAADRFSDLKEMLQDGDRMAEALKQIADTFEPSLLTSLDTRYWRQSLLIAWAKKSPIAALDHALASFPVSRPGGSQNHTDFSGCMRGAMQGILQDQPDLDPVALTRWYTGRMAATLSRRQGWPQREALQTIGREIAGMALKAHSREALLLMCSAENELRLGLFDSIADAAGDAESMAMMTSLVPELGTPNLRAKLMDSILNGLGSLDYESGQKVVENVSDPQQRLDWALKLAGPNQHIRDGIPIPQDSRKSRADWWLSMASPDQHVPTATRIAESWDFFDPAWSDQWLQRQISHEAFLNFVGKRFQEGANNRLWEMKIPKYNRDMSLQRLRMDAAILRRMDPQGGQALIQRCDELDARYHPDRPKLSTFLTP